MRCHESLLPAAWDLKSRVEGAWIVHLEMHTRAFIWSTEKRFVWIPCSAGRRWQKARWGRRTWWSWGWRTPAWCTPPAGCWGVTCCPHTGPGAPSQVAPENQTDQISTAGQTCVGRSAHLRAGVLLSAPRFCGRSLVRLRGLERGRAGARSQGRWWRGRGRWWEAFLDDRCPFFWKRATGGELSRGELHRREFHFRKKSKLSPVQGRISHAQGRRKHTPAQGRTRRVSSLKTSEESTSSSTDGTSNCLKRYCCISLFLKNIITGSVEY